MRILFSFVGGNGHWQPLVPLARAAAARGHDVVVTGQARLVRTVEAAGFTAISSGGDPSPPARLPLLPLDGVREARVLRDGYAGSIARRHACHVATLVREYGPDVLVCDELDFGAMLAAEAACLPYASVLVIAAGAFVRLSTIAEPLERLRKELGLPADPECTMLHRYLTLAPFPRAYRAPEFRLPAPVHHYRAVPCENADDVRAQNVDVQRSPDLPLVYFTLGTVFNTECGDLFQRVVTGLHTLPIQLVVTVGENVDPAELGPLPANVHVRNYVPQAALLPHARLVVSHGGSGSVLGALAYGVPMVILPLGADQPDNAARCEALGVARVLDAVAATPAIIREAAEDVLVSPRYRAAATRLRDAVSALPSAEHAVALIERLARERRPLSNA